MGKGEKVAMEARSVALGRPQLIVYCEKEMLNW